MSLDPTCMRIEVPCHICGHEQLDELRAYPSLPRVASDCVPWRSGGKLATCPACHCVQNPVDPAWHQETMAVYSKYKIYQQSAGSEQGVLVAGKKQMSRSAKVFQQAAPYLDFSTPGRLLDLGCANGELLRSFGALAPHWKMVGFEIDDKRRQEVESIPGVEAFYSGSLEQITQRFDLITLIHVFEHLPFPGKWLEKLKPLLTPRGQVLIQVPDPKINPYNLLVADHCSHFILPDLLKIAENAGFEIITYADNWVAREFSLLIKPRSGAKVQTWTEGKLAEQYTPSFPGKAVQWLHDIVKQAKEIPFGQPRGIWGTAIAATWLYSLMDNSIDFFVDEDVNRIGQSHLGKPIYSPEHIPAASRVFIALTPEIAANIVNRWSHLNASLLVPPELIYG